MNPTAEEKTGVVRITLTEADGSEKVLEVSEDLHFIFGFAKASPGTISQIPMEINVKGFGLIVAEIFYQIGEQHPQLVEHCVRRLAQKVLEGLKAKGIDPGAEAFKNAPVVGGIQ